MKTPYFLIRQDILEKNISDFQAALNEEWPNSKLAYSVKTNSLPWVLTFLHGKDVLAEVVSDEEYDLVGLCGYSSAEIVFNGPIKGEAHFKDAAENGAFINVDSKQDLSYLSRFAKPGMRIGIRVNVPTDCFSSEDIDYEENGFRFGFSVENGDFLAVLKAIQRDVPDAKLGLHLHCNSITRSVNVYRAIARYAASLVVKYNLALDFIDMGGGYFGGVVGKPTQKQYIRAICEELTGVVDHEKTMLIVEPGSAIIGSAVDLHTTVLDVKDTNCARIVTTDGSRIHIDPLWTKSRYMYELNSKLNREFPRQIICGYTCMDHDRIMTLENQKELSVGDEIVYKRVGAYSMTFGGMFIRYYPEVYVEGAQGENKMVRKRANVQEYYELHSNLEV